VTELRIFTRSYVT